MLDASLPILVGIQATLTCARRGDRWWLAGGKETLIGVVFPTMLSIVLAIAAGSNWPKVWQRR